MESNSYIPEELVDEILLRLPVKALLRLKSVCKEWCTLITSPSFVSRHYSHESNQNCLFFRRKDTADKNQYFFSMYEDDESQKPICLPQIHTDARASRRFIGPEQGLFCVVNDYLHSIGLLNPATREFKRLPPHPLHKRYDYFNPVIGLGLDPCSGDFKVVVFAQSDHILNYAFVYNLTSDSWKRIEPVKEMNFILGASYVTQYQILNGVLHWLVTFTFGADPFILAFDMGSEKFQEIPIPDALRSAERLTPVQITAYDDHSIALLSFEFGNYDIDLWVMGRDGLWSKNKSLSITNFLGYRLWPLCVWKKKKVFFETYAGLTMYDISTKKLTTVIRSRKGSMWLPPNYARTGTVYLQPNAGRHFIYKESLVSVKGEREPFYFYCG